LTTHDGIAERFHKTLLDEFYRVARQGDGATARRRSPPSLTRCRLRRRI